MGLDNIIGMAINHLNFGEWKCLCIYFSQRNKIETALPHEGCKTSPYHLMFKGGSGRLGPKSKTITSTSGEPPCNKRQMTDTYTYRVALLIRIIISLIM